METRKAVLVSTGGTIEMTPGPGGYSIGRDRGRLPDPDILPPWLDVTHMKLFSLPSPHMTPSKMATLARELHRLEACGEWDGIVVTHGTDTLEESAFLADVHLQGLSRVVFTAAMRGADELGVDGPRNVRGALLTSVSDDFHNFGVVVVLNDEIHAAARVTKTYTSNVSSFASPGYGPLGFVDGDAVMFTRAPLRRLRLPPGELVLDERVGLVRTAAGLGAREVAHCVACGDRAIVVEAFGRGNVPPDVADAIELAVSAGVIVVVTSRCYMGRVLGVYGYVGGGADLERRGALLAGDMPGHKTRLFLMACLGSGLGTEGVRCLLGCL